MIATATENDAIASAASQPAWPVVRSFATWSPPAVALVAVVASALALERSMLLLIIAAAVYAWLLSALYVVYLRRVSRKAGRLQFTTRQLMILVTSLSVVLSVPTSNWPLRLRFELSRGAAESMADRVEESGRFSGPERAGLWFFEGAEINRAGQACLWTELRPGGNRGFVRCRPGDDGPKLNLWSSIPIDGRWFYVAED